MYCSQCATELSVNDIYCPSCAKPVASFAFYSTDVAQVEPLVETEPPIVRPSPIPAENVHPVKIAAILVGGIFVGALCFGIYKLIDKAIDRVGGSKPSNDRALATPVKTQTQVLAPTQTPMPSQTPRPKPSPTPFDIEAERAQVEAAERTNRSIATAANMISNAANAINNATNTNRVLWPPPFDRYGRRLRAICNDGSLSYWQHDALAVCLTKGGPRVRYW